LSRKKETSIQSRTNFDIIDLMQIIDLRKPIGAMRKYFFIWRPPLNLSGGRHLN